MAWQLSSKNGNDVATSCCNRQEEGMGIVLQQSHYNLEAMLQDGWTSNYKECCTNMTALPGPIDSGSL